MGSWLKYAVKSADAGSAGINGLVLSRSKTSEKLELVYLFNKNLLKLDAALSSREANTVVLDKAQVLALKESISEFLKDVANRDYFTEDWVEHKIKKCNYAENGLDTYVDPVRHDCWIELQLELATSFTPNLRFVGYQVRLTPVEAVDMVAKLEEFLAEKDVGV